MQNDTGKVKRCTRCEETKTLAEFGRDKRSKGGRLPRCRACANSINSTWRKNNKERNQAHQARYREANRDKCAAADKRWRANNPEAARETVARSRRKHAANVNAITAFRYARKRKATPPWLTRAHRAVMQEAYAQAVIASEVLGEPYHVDHIVPLCGANVCGLHVPWNLRVITAHGNRLKGNRLES